MKEFPLIMLLFILTVSGCAGSENRHREYKPIELYIEQGGSRIEIRDNTAELRRAPFSFILNFPRPDSIFINASFGSETFTNAGLGLPLDELIGFRNPGIDEEPYNRQSLLYVSGNTPNLWYYTDDKDHRFNLVKKHENSILCQRNITSVADVDSDNQVTEISKLKKETIFLVIVTFDWNEDYTRMIEKNRQMIKLKFIL